VGVGGLRQRVVTVALAVGLASALPGASPALADGGTPVPSPTDPGFGAVGGSLVGPVLDEIRVAAALSVESAAPGPAAPGLAAPGPAGPAARGPAAALEPGGGSSSSPTPWQPRADIRVPTAVASGSGGARGGPRSKDEVLWAA